jgi:hypothetical protein
MCSWLLIKDLVSHMIKEIVKKDRPRRSSRLSTVRHFLPRLRYRASLGSDSQGGKPMKPPPIRPSGFTHFIASLLLAMALPAHAASAFKTEVTGNGPPVIPIPGLASSGEVWQDTAAHLCRQRQCHKVQIAMADSARHFLMYDEREWMYARIDQFLQ